MSLTSGTRIGPYEVLGKLGAGGMGEVYRARDTTLGREVAIKILPDLLAVDPERLSRFEREAQTLASLNHPHIAQIYGVVELPDRAGQHALVMELVEGEDLAIRIERGPIPLDEVLPIARQIADALESAHEQGIVHRDLKPANIKIRPDGTVKVLDFGLAKAADPATTSSGALANSPTFTAHATQMGMIVGTAAYMAPEQARGRAVDRRADIWAFGVVLFEMLTGRRAFDGDDVSDLLASVLKSDPAWTAIPAETPASLRRLLRRCLEKDPRKRLSSIGDARLELDEPESPPSPASAPAVRPRRSLVQRVWPITAAVAITAVTAALIWRATRPAEGSLTRLSILPPSGVALYPDSTGVAISPDGMMVAFIVGSLTRSETQLWVRPIDSMAARRLDGGDGANLPFWSPDSRRIGFFTNTKLMTIAASGGRAEVLADAPGGRGGAWTASNLILYAPDASGPLYRINASGGTPEALTTIDASRKQYGHRFPALLPDGDHFLYAALPSRNGKFDIFAGSLSGGTPTLVGAMESAPVYADPGWLLYARHGVLVAQQFDARRRATTGDPVVLDDEPSAVLDPQLSFTAGRPASISRAGSLAYYSAPSLNTVAEWFDTSGLKTGTLDVPAGHYDAVRIAPDGGSAVFVRSTSASESALWLVDLAHGGASPLSSDLGRSDTPIWSPDGTQVLFASDRDGASDIFVKTIGDASPERPLYRSDVLFKSPSAYSPDGKWIVVTQLDPSTAQNIWLLPASGGALRPYVAGPTRDNGGPVSPDGRWMAYVSDDTGRYQLFVQPFPAAGRRVQVSQSGATYAWWTSDGRQILFLGDDLRTLFRADVDAGAAFHAATPKQIAQLPPNILAIDAMPDRSRFLALVPEATGTGSITVVQNWRAAIDKRQ